VRFLTEGSDVFPCSRFLGALGAVAVLVLALTVSVGFDVPRAEAAGGSFTVVDTINGPADFIGDDTALGLTYLVHVSTTVPIETTVRVYDSMSLALQNTVVVPIHPSAFGVNSVTHRLFFTTENGSTGTLSTFDRNVAPVGSPVPTYVLAGELMVDESRNRVLVSNSHGNDVAVIDTAANAFTRLLFAAGLGYIYGAGFDPVSDTVFVAGPNPGSKLIAINATTGVESRRVDLYNSGEVSFDPLSNSVWVSHMNTDQKVSIYEASTLGSLGDIDVPSGGASHIEIDATTGIAYSVMPRVDGPALPITVIDTMRRVIIDSVTPPASHGIRLNRLTHRLFSMGDSDVSVISGLGLDALSASTPIFRFYSPVSGSHFYTTSELERDGIRARYPEAVWTYEGVAYNAYEGAVPGTVPLYRFWSSALEGHFYTPSLAERDQVIAAYDDNTWLYEGVAYYVFPVNTGVVGAQPVARFWSPSARHHFYTANADEATFVRVTYPPSVWSYEGSAFAIPPS